MTATKKTYTRKKLPVVTIRKRGDSWQADVTWMGERKRPTFGTQAEAQAWAAEQTTRMSQGLPLSDPDTFVPRAKGDDADGRPVTMWELYEHTRDRHWLKKGPNGGPMKGSKGSIINARQCAEVLGPKTNFRTLTLIGVENKLEAFAKERSNAAATANRRIAALKVMFSYGKKHWPTWTPPELEMTDEDNVCDFRIPPRLEADILQYWIARSDIDMYDYTVLATWLGQRSNETRRLRLAESTAHSTDGYIDGEHAIFPAQNNKTKSTFKRFVPLRPIVMEVIERRRAQAETPNARIFPADFDGDHVAKSWKKLREHFVELRHPDVVSQKKDHQDLGHEFKGHACRHEFCSRLGDAGFTLAEIKQFSGHRTDSTCERYVKDNRVALRMRMQRDGQFDPSKLEGGPVPAFAPSLTNNVVSIAARPKAKPKAAPAPAEVDKATQILQALAGLGLTLDDLNAAAKRGD